MGRRCQLLGPVLVALSLATTLAGCGAQDLRTVEPAATPGSWNQTHRVDLPTGWIIGARNVGPTDESTSLEGPRSTGCLVSSSPAEPKHYWGETPTTVRVQGTDGWFGDRDPQYGPFPTQVVWQGRDRWFAVSCNLDRAGILRIAERVRTEANAVRVPFRLTSIPQGVRMSQLIESRTDDGVNVAAQFEQLVDGSPPGIAPSMQISAVGAEEFNPGPAEIITVAGRRVEVRRQTQTLCLRTKSDPICVWGPAGEPATDWSPEARRIAEQTVAVLQPVADSADTASWLDADEAFPR